MYFSDISTLSQVDLMNAILDHSALIECRALLGLGARKERLAMSTILGSVAQSYGIMKTRNSKDALATRRALTVSISTPGAHAASLMRATSRLLKIHPRSLRAGRRRRQIIEAEPLGAIWAYGGRAPRCDKVLVGVVKETIERFWVENCRASPIFKNVIRKRIGRGDYIEHHACFLDQTQTQLYCLFLQTHPELRIGQRSFDKCKPWFVRVTRERDTCCCRYHVEFAM
jgi:hypothetical protein